MTLLFLGVAPPAYPANVSSREHRSCDAESVGGINASLRASLRALRRAIPGKGIGWVEGPLQGSAIRGTEEQRTWGYRGPLSLL